LSVYAVLKGFTKYMILPRRNLKSRYGGGWALVTGASDGIGKEYSMQLAKSGFNIILMARN
jgi:17beta-estradiol 17-dehydrogenase / very-long-chain 3-oxoacyl-CoA reductase